jgi:hypothetical protein
MADADRMTPGAAPDRLQWEIDVPILTHPLMVLGFVKIFALAGFVMWALLAFMFAMQGDYKLIGQMALFTAAIVGGIMIVGALATLLFYRNRIHMRFTLDADAALAETLDTRVRRVNRLAILLGALAGKPGAVGAGLIGEATASTKAAWSSVAAVRTYPRWNVIGLGNSWRTTMYLFCPPAMYEAALAHVTAARKAHPARVRGNPVPGLLIRTVLVAIACVPFFNLPVKIDLFAPFFTLCFALASVWLIPHLAWATFLGLGWIVVATAAQALEPFRSMFSGQTMARWEIFSGDDFALLALAFAGATFLIWTSIGLLTGRISSGLAGDLIEMDDA